MKKNSGFTLVELAIVMMIIGLLIGGILKGQELASNARVKGVIKEINGYSAAIKAFQDAYGALAGDMATATFRLPGCTATNFCYNGNGNNVIGRAGQAGTGSGWSINQAGTTGAEATQAYETTQFWKHLMLSGYITGVNPDANPARPAWAETHPASVMAGGYHVFTDTNSAGSSLSLRLQGPVTGNPMGNPGSRPLTGNQAKQIDEKIDDGKPGDGYVWGVPFDAGGCRTSSGNQWVTASMQLKNCAMHMIIH